MNPTSVRGKQREFQALLNNHHCNVIALAETSATIDTQFDTTRQLKKLGLHATWSNPVQPQSTRIDGQPSLRGRAGGTAMFTSLPCRASRHPTNEYWKSTTRLLHVVLTVGTTDIQVFVLYGATSSLPNAVQFNEDLISEAVHQSQLLPLPTIIMGDFNMKIQETKPYQTLFAKGYRSIDHVYSTKYGSVMPPSCNEATNPDLAIISPELLGYITHVSVDKTKLFDTHDPVVFSLELPSTPPSVLRYQIPKSWSDFPIQQDQLATAMQQHPNMFADVTTYSEWNAKVEALVDATIRGPCNSEADTFPVKHLPKAYRGRFKQPKPRLFPHQSQVRQGRQGDYEPLERFVQFAPSGRSAIYDASRASVVA